MEHTERRLIAERAFMKKFKRSALWSNESNYEYISIYKVEVIGFTRYSDRA